MSLHVSQEVNLTRTWTVGGRSYQVSGVTLYQIAELSDHLRQVLKHPIDAARDKLSRLGDLADEQTRRQIVLDAVNAADDGAGRWPPAFDGPLGQRYFFGTPEGMAFFLWVVLKNHQPNLTLDEVRRDVAPKVSLRDFESLNDLIGAESEEAITDRKARHAGLAVAATETEKPEPAGMLTTEGEVEAPKASNGPRLS